MWELDFSKCWLSGNKPYYTNKLSEKNIDKYTTNIQRC